MTPFTKEAAAAARDTLEDIFEALPKPRQRSFAGHLDQVLGFLDAAEKAAPCEVPPSTT